MNRQTYILELEELIGDDTLILLQADNERVKSLFCVVMVGDEGASIIDNGYRCLEEIKATWPEALPPVIHMGKIIDGLLDRRLGHA